MLKQSKLVGIFQKNKSEEIRINEGRLKGNDVVDVRVFSNFKHDDYYPTKYGFTFLKDKWNDFVESVNRVSKK